MFPIGARLQYSNVEDGYPEILREILNNGHYVSPRGKTTVEFAMLMIKTQDPTTNMIPEGDHAAFLESERRTVLAGEEPDMKASDELIERLDLEEDGTFYEQDIRDTISQNWDDWREQLQSGPETRKIVATFGDEANPPCTSMLQFMFRGGALHMMTVNRSQDMIFAYPMDMGLFEFLQVHMAERLGAKIGKHVHVIGSAHIYEEQIDKARELI